MGGGQGRGGWAGPITRRREARGLLGWLRPPSERPTMRVAPERNLAPQLAIYSSAYSLQTLHKGSEWEQGP